MHEGLRGHKGGRDVKRGDPQSGRKAKEGQVMPENPNPLEVQKAQIVQEVLTFARGRNEWVRMRSEQMKMLKVELPAEVLPFLFQAMSDDLRQTFGAQCPLYVVEFLLSYMKEPLRDDIRAALHEALSA